MVESMTGHLGNISGELNLILELVILVIKVKIVTYFTYGVYSVNTFGILPRLEIS